MLTRGEAFHAYYYMAEVVTSGKGHDEDPNDSGGGTEHTLYWGKDGGAAAETTNSPERVDAANAPGWYRVLITAEEADCYIGNLYVKSPTNGVTDGIRWFVFQKHDDFKASPAAIADAVWDEMRADHTIVGSFGEALDSKVSTVAGDVWDIEAGLHESIGSFGYVIQNLPGIVWDIDIEDHDTEGTFGHWVQNIEIEGGGGSNIGPGAILCTLNIKDSQGNAQADTEVWITTGNNAHTDVVAGTRETDADGNVTFMLDEGTYYRWAQKTGADFDNPQTFTVVSEE